MPTKNISDTEVNPTYASAGGGGARTGTWTEINPTYVVNYGGGLREWTLTEINPMAYGVAGGGWRIAVITEGSPTYKLGGGQVGLNPALLEFLLE